LLASRSGPSTRPMWARETARPVMESMMVSPGVAEVSGSAVSEGAQFFELLNEIYERTRNEGE
jgi:hypothetical protein